MTPQLHRAGLLALLLVGTPAAALAGSCTSESIISRQDAISNASSGMPAGDQITNVSCMTMVRDLSPRYRCNVTWGPASPGAGG